MKPNIFIGSSKESLSIAYAIQENLDHDANPTVWTQGIFKLNNSTLSDLLNALKTYDFAIFVFSPEDISIIRNIQHSTTRDNVLFEFGLFMGRLGKDRVFYVIPRDTKDFHLPSDLIGVNPGTYNNNRDNLLAALGPFCNHIRSTIKLFTYENFQELSGETSEAKRIAIEKPRGWEYLLLSELLENRLSDLNILYNNIETETIFIKTVRYDNDRFRIWFAEAVEDLTNFTKVLINLFHNSFNKKEGQLWLSCDISRIKRTANNFGSLAKELLIWHQNAVGMDVSQDFRIIKNLLLQLSVSIYKAINNIPQELRRVSAEYLSKAETDVSFTIDIGLDQIMDIEIILKKFNEIEDILYPYDIKTLQIRYRR